MEREDTPQWLGSWFPTSFLPSTERGKDEYLFIVFVCVMALSELRDYDLKGVDGIYQLEPSQSQMSARAWYKIDGDPTNRLDRDHSWNSLPKFVTLYLPWRQTWLWEDGTVGDTHAQGCSHPGKVVGTFMCVQSLALYRVYLYWR